MFYIKMRFSALYKFIYYLYLQLRNMFSVSHISDERNGKYADVPVLTLNILRVMAYETHFDALPFTVMFYLEE